MSRPLSTPPLGARYECGGPCSNCSEPIVRLRVDGKAAPSRWLHTPNRLYCLTVFGEVTARVATPRLAWPVVSAVAR